MRTREERRGEERQVRKRWATCRGGMELRANSGECWRGVIVGGCGLLLGSGCVMHEGAIRAGMECVWVFEAIGQGTARGGRRVAWDIKAVGLPKVPGLGKKGGLDGHG